MHNSSTRISSKTVRGLAVGTVILSALGILGAALVSYLPVRGIVYDHVSGIAVFMFVVLCAGMAVVLYIAKGEREREAGALNEIFMQHSPLVMNIWDDAANITATSPHAVKMFELDSMEQYVERFFDLSPEYQPCGTPSREKSLRYNTQAFEEGFVRFEWMHQKLNGEPIPTEVILHRFTRKGKPFLATFAIDLRPAIAMQGREVSERTRLMLETIPLMVEYWNQDIESIDCNKATLDFNGFASREEYREYLKKSSAASPVEGYDGDSHRKRWAAHIRQIFADGYGRFEWEEPNYEGTFVQLEIEGSCLHINQEPIVVAYARDISARKKMEKEREDLMHKLEDANEAKRKFLFNMSHEIRTPMSAIIGMAGIAQSTDDPARKDDCIDKISKASKHLLGIINQILDMTKIEAEHFVLASEAFQFAKMIDEVVSVLHFSIEEKGLFLQVVLDEAIPRRIVSDETRFAQVLANLLSNAVKFTAEGGRITLSAQMCADGNENVLRVEVSDTGIGIGAEQQPHLFGDFVQVESDAARRFGGTGLGLALSKRIIELMGGRIWVESEVDKGARFIFTVPVRACEEHAPAEPEAPETNRYKGHTVLVAEDMDINREIINALLESTGITIECAANGQQAVQMFEAAPGRYDLIFMDVQMPEMDGVTATRRIRALGTEKAKQIPIIAMTANVFREDIDACLKAGMNAHLGKPLAPAQVFEVLDGWLGICGKGVAEAR